jgi:hypothetical protein
MEAPMDDCMDARIRHNEQTALRVMGAFVKHPIRISVEDRMRAKIVEALVCLDQRVPAAAHKALLEAIKL